MTDEIDYRPTIISNAPPRRPWVTPSILVGECHDSESGSGIYASDVATTSVHLTGS